MVGVSVVVPTFRSRSDTPVAEALRQQSFRNYELLLQSEAPVTRARNAGIAAAESDKIVFLDDDSRPRPGYLSRAVAVLDDHEAFAGRTVHPRDDLFERFFTGHYDWGTTARPVDRFWGCNMGVHRDVFETIGGWNEQMGWGHEERELAERVLTEYDIWYDPSLVVDHPYADSVPDFWRKQYQLETNKPYLWQKAGVSLPRQCARIVGDLLDPRGYPRRTPTATIASTGAKLARAAGRLRGVVTWSLGSTREVDEDVDTSVPVRGDDRGH